MSAEQPPNTTQVVVQQPGVTKEDLKTLETVFNAKLSSLRAWGVAALIGGQALAGLIGAIVAPERAAEVATLAVRHLPF
jgi:predicted alpha/beta-hydrolase family hydrolase